MKQYLDLVKTILEQGEVRKDRTGTGTKQIFGTMERYDLRDGKLPLITTRKLGIQFMIKELLWFLKGSGNCDYLDQQKVKIWKPWTEPTTNSIGPLYPVQLRNWPHVGVTYNGEGLKEDDRIIFKAENNDDHETIEVYERHYDQLANLIQGIKDRPHSRRHLISYWNVPYMADETKSPHQNVLEGRAALSACHTLLQFNVSGDELSCMLYMRSSDVMVGRPTNIAQYSILTHMIAQVCGLKAKEFIITSADTHIYLDHIPYAEELIKRRPYQSPSLVLNPEIKDIDDFKLEDFTLVNYFHGEPMKLPVAV